MRHICVVSMVLHSEWTPTMSWIAPAQPCGSRGGLSSFPHQTRRRLGGHSSMDMCQMWAHGGSPGFLTSWALHSCHLCWSYNYSRPGRGLSVPLSHSHEALHTSLWTLRMFPSIAQAAMALPICSRFAHMGDLTASLCHQLCNKSTYGTLATICGSGEAVEQCWAVLGALLAQNAVIWPKLAHLWVYISANMSWRVIYSPSHVTMDPWEGLDAIWSLGTPTVAWYHPK